MPTVSCHFTFEVFALLHRKKCTLLDIILTVFSIYHGPIIDVIWSYCDPLAISTRGAWEYNLKLQYVKEYVLSNLQKKTSLKKYLWKKNILY